MALRTHGKSGLARAECLLFLSILLVVASVAVPALVSWRQFKDTRRTYTDLRVIISAVRQYQKEYNSWPGAEPGDKNDLRYGYKIPNARVMRILMAVDGPGNEGHAANRKQINFITMKSSDGLAPDLNAEGDAVDPWGTPYQMVFDSNFDSTCHAVDSTYGEITGEEIAAWSAGPDRKSDTDDDIRSWLRP